MSNQDRLGVLAGLGVPGDLIPPAAPRPPISTRAFTAQG
jgi:hypothetical protein